jgi:hypothetical protein
MPNPYRAEKIRASARGATVFPEKRGSDTLSHPEAAFPLMLFQPMVAIAENIGTKDSSQFVFKAILWPSDPFLKCRSPLKDRRTLRRLADRHLLERPSHGFLEKVYPVKSLLRRIR